MKALRLALLAALLGPAAALADRPELSASLGLLNEFHGNRAYDLVDTDDHLPAGRVAAGASVPVGAGFLDGDLAFRWSGTSATAHGSIATDLGLLGVQLGATYRRPVWTYLHVTGTVLGGLDWVTLSLASATRLSQTVLSPAGTALLGAQVPIPLGRLHEKGPVLVLLADAGYTLRPTLGFHRLAPAPITVAAGADPAIPRGTVDVGSLGLSGFTWRLQAAVRF